MSDLMWPCLWILASLFAIAWQIYLGVKSKASRLDNGILTVALACLIGWGIVALPRLIAHLDQERMPEMTGLHTKECWQNWKKEQPCPHQ